MQFTFKHISIFLCLLGMFSTELFAQLDRSKAPAAGPAPKIQIGKPSSFTLENGLQVFVVENHKIPRVAFSLTLDLDPIFEGDKLGYIEMAGDLMRRGTANKTKDELDAEVDFIGATLATYSTGIYGVSLKKHTDKLLGLMSDVLLNPKFPNEELDKLKTEALSALKNGVESPGFIASNIRSKILYGADHPYGEVQTQSNIENITAEDCKEYYQTYFRPNVGYLVVVGDITIDEAKPLVQNYFGSWTKAEVPKHSFAKPKQPDVSKVALGSKTGAVQTVLSVSYPVDLKLGDEDYIAASMMNRILGGSFGSYLNKNLREDKGYTYGARSSLSPDKVIGSFRAGAEVRTEVTDSALTQILFELDRIRTEKVSDEVLSRNKSIASGSFARSLENPQTIARFALNIIRYNLPTDFYETYLEKINSITVEDIQRVAQKYILPGKAHLIAVGDVTAIESKLSAFGETTKYDAFGEELVPMDQSGLGDVSVESVIERYLEALGGRKKLEAIQSVKTMISMSVQGADMSLTLAKQDGDKFASLMEIPMMGMEIKQIYNDGKGVADGPQGRQTLEGQPLEDLMHQAPLFYEMSYGDLGVKAEIGEIAKIGSEEVYVVVFTSPSGKKSYRSYSMESGLLLKVDTGENTVEQGDFREVEGIMMPYQLILSSPMGELEASVTKIELNGDIPSEIFSLE